MGFKEDFTDGKTEEDWVRAIFDYSDLPKYVSWEEFEKKGYFVIPLPDDYVSTPSLRWFYEGRECDTPDPGNPKKGTDRSTELATYSGKIEFVSQDLTQYFPNDKERPTMARYIPSWEGKESDLADKYPLQLVSPHPRYSYHTHFDKHVEWMGEIPGQRVFKSGYAWWVARIHPSDAKPRGIKEGDIVKLYNDRGAVLCYTHLTERCKPGVVHSYTSCGKYDPVEPGKPYSVDRGGCVNLLTSARMLSQNAPGMAPNSCLIEVSKWEDE
jgi:trimethylamine-N-oxide reductase (cytochrome c)